MVCCIVMRTEECALPGVFIHSLERDNTKEFVAKTIKHVLIINVDLPPKMSLMLVSVSGEQKQADVW